MEPSDGSAKEPINAEHVEKPKEKQVSSKQRLFGKKDSVRSVSRLPRIVRSPSKFYRSTILTTSSRKSDATLDNSGDTNDNSGPSKLTNNVKTKKEHILDKVKPSHIPRRKSVRDDMRGGFRSVIRNNPCTTNQFIPEDRNVQRINLMINPDFSCREQTEQTASLASSRPIPTLGNIYGHVDIIDNDRFNDWFMELNASTPMTAMESTSRSINCETTDSGRSPDRCFSTITAPSSAQQELKRATVVVGSDKSCERSNTANPNKALFLTSEIELPTRDNESGYRSMSPDSKNKSNSQTGNTKVAPEDNYYGDLTSTESSVTSTMLKDQPTVVLCKSPEVVKERLDESLDVYLLDAKKPGSGAATYSTRISSEYTEKKIPNLIVPSYTECLSEILQKTTNFEALEVFGPPSSTACTDLEVPDNLSNCDTLEAMDRLGILNEHSTSGWTQRDHERSSDSFKTDSTPSRTCRTETSELLNSVYNWKPRYYPRYYNDSHDYSYHCKKVQKYKRFPSNRYKLPNSLRKWPRRISIRRICRRRWVYMWKKTAQHWAKWSSKTPLKTRKMQVMQYMQQPTGGEDVDVQTNSLKCQDTGTDSELKEKKSACISAQHSWHSNEKIDKGCSSPVQKASRFKNVNLSPSMFPFEPKRKVASTSKAHRKPEAKSCAEFASNKFKRHSSDFVWNTTYHVHEIHEAKSCQYDGIMPTNVGTSTSFEEMDEPIVSDQYADTDDLSKMADQVTSTFVRLSPLWLPVIKSKEAFTESPAYSNAATEACNDPVTNDVMTETHVIETNNITFYKPCLGTEMTHLMPAPTQPHHLSMFCMMQLMKTAATSTSQHEIPPGDKMGKHSTEMVSLSVTTSRPAFGEKTTSIISESLTNLDETKEKGCQTETDDLQTLAAGPSFPNTKLEELCCQTQIEGIVSITEVETQVSRHTSTDAVIMVAVVTSVPSLQQKRSTYVSDCILLDSLGKEKENNNYCIQTQPQLPKLEVSGPKIMSISSRMLTEKAISNTEIGGGQLKEIMDGTGIMSISSKVLSEKCISSSDIPSLHKSIHTDCAQMPTLSQLLQPTMTCEGCTYTRINNCAETKSLSIHSTKSAVNGTGSFNIEDNSIADAATQVSSTLTGLRNVSFVFPGYNPVGTNTDLALESRSVGGASTDIPCSWSKSSKADAEMQYEARSNDNVNIFTQSQLISTCMLTKSWTEHETQTDNILENASQEPMPQPQYFSNSMMTSNLAIAASVQAYPNSRESVEKTVVNMCACVPPEKEDNATSTDNIFGLKNEQHAQTSVLQVQKSTAVSCDPFTKSFSSKTHATTRSSINNQLLTLSRLLGTRQRTSSYLDTNLPSSVFSSDLNADKWIKACTSMDKNAYAYRTLIDSATEFKPAACTFSLLTKKSSIVPPEIKSLISNDSLAEILPMEKPKEDVHESHHETLQNEVEGDVTGTPPNLTVPCPEHVITSSCLLPSAAPDECFEEVEKKSITSYKLEPEIEEELKKSSGKSIASQKPVTSPKSVASPKSIPSAKSHLSERKSSMDAPPKLADLCPEPIVTSSCLVPPTQPDECREEVEKQSVTSYHLAPDQLAPEPAEEVKKSSIKLIASRLSVTSPKPLASPKSIASAKSNISEKKSLVAPVHSKSHSSPTNGNPPVVPLSLQNSKEVEGIVEGKDEIVQHHMVYTETSEPWLTKELNENTLQASPSLSEMGTEPSQLRPHRSVCVFTSRCILPTCRPCNYARNACKHDTSCMFVFGEPVCAMHRQCDNNEVQTTEELRDYVNIGVSNERPQLVERTDVGVITPFFGMIPEQFTKKTSSNVILSPTVYKELYEKTKMIVNEDTNQPPVKEAKSPVTVPEKPSDKPIPEPPAEPDPEKDPPKPPVTHMDAEVEVLKSFMVDQRSAGVVTSAAHYRCKRGECFCKRRHEVTDNAPNTQHNMQDCTLLYAKAFVDGTESSSKLFHAKVLYLPQDNNVIDDEEENNNDKEEVPFEECMKTQLVTSCRYYSNLLTKRLGRVRDNWTRHLRSAEEELLTRNLGTMKPSGRKELGCQTPKRNGAIKRLTTYGYLSPTTSQTDICKNDKIHLNSMYNVMSAVEGRLRRLKISPT